MRFVPVFLLAALPLASGAQPVPVSSEEVAPLPGIASHTVPAPAPAPVSPSVAVSPVGLPAAPVSYTIADYFVPSLRVELPAAGVSSTLRDMALGQAARDGLSRILGNAEPPLEPARLARLVADTPQPMSLVREYRIASEELTPSYTLVVDMSYRPDAVMDLLKPAPTPLAEAISVPTAVTPTLTVRVSGNAGAQDKVWRILGVMGLHPLYTRLAGNAADIGIADANADTLTTQLRAKGLVAEQAPDGAVEVHF